MSIYLPITHKKKLRKTSNDKLNYNYYKYTAYGIKWNEKRRMSIFVF